MKATVAPTKEFRRPSLSWIKRNSTRTSVKQILNENSRTSTIGDSSSHGELLFELCHIKHQTTSLDDPLTNEQQSESTTNNRIQTAIKYNIDEKIPMKTNLMASTIVKQVFLAG